MAPMDEPDLLKLGVVLDGWCPSCGYDLRGLSDGGEVRCPECGRVPEQLPRNGIIVCEPGRLTFKVRVGLGFLLICAAGFVALAVLMGRDGVRSGDRQEAVLGFLLGGLFTVLVPAAVVAVWRAERPGRRVTVDLNRGTVRFERFLLKRHLRPAVSTGAGLELRFDQILASKSTYIGARGGLEVTTPGGRIFVDGTFSNFRLLLAVVRTIAPKPPFSAARDMAGVLLLLMVILLIVGGFAAGAHFGWW
jgi:hypothetical protein